MSECQACSGFGYIWSELDKFPQACSCKMMNEKSFKIAKELDGEEYKDFNLSTFEKKESHQKYMHKIATKFLSRRGTFSILFLGQAGAGKTHLCFSVAKELMKKGAWLEIIKFDYLIYLIERTLDDVSALNQVIEKYLQCDYLLIDDYLNQHYIVRGGRSTRFIYEKYLRLINYIIQRRRMWKKPILLTSELLLDEIAKISPESALSLKQMATHYDNQFIIQIDRDEEKNYRRKKEAKENASTQQI